jgi:hypothetical protein
MVYQMTAPQLDLRQGISKPVLLMISRRQVEDADIESVLFSLKPFLATREDAWLYRGQMMLSVDGLLKTMLRAGICMFSGNILPAAPIDHQSRQKPAPR